MKQSDELPRLARQVPIRLVRYLAAGVFSAALEWSLFLLLFYVCHWPVIWANTASFILGLSVSFVLAKYWVFLGRHQHKTSLQAAMYVGLALFNVVVSGLIVTSLSHVIPAGLAKLVTMAAVVIWNFALMHFRIFGPDTDDSMSKKQVTQ